MGRKSPIFEHERHSRTELAAAARENGRRAAARASRCRAGSARRAAVSGRPLASPVPHATDALPPGGSELAVASPGPSSARGAPAGGPPPPNRAARRGAQEGVTAAALRAGRHWRDASGSAPPSGTPVLERTCPAARRLAANCLVPPRTLPGRHRARAAAWATTLLVAERPPHRCATICIKSGQWRRRRALRRRPAA